MSLPPANWDVFLDDACVLCLLFEEGEGDTAHDLSRFRNDGTVYGATWVGTPYGRGLEFDGIDDYVEVPDGPAFDWEDELTIEAVIKPRSWGESEYGRIAQKGGEFEFYVRGHGDNNLGFWVYVTEGFDHVESYKNTVRLGEWHHVVGVYDGSGLRIFVNGEPASGVTSLTGAVRNTTSVLTIASRTGADRWFDGTIALVRIYNRALSADEIRALYQNYRYGLACYKLIGQVINPLISDTYERVELIRKIQTNRWKIENNQLVIYDDDGVTPLKVFNLKDKYGNPSEVNVYEREPV